MAWGRAGKTTDNAPSLVMIAEVAAGTRNSSATYLSTAAMECDGIVQHDEMAESLRIVRKKPKTNSLTINQSISQTHR